MKQFSSFPNSSDQLDSDRKGTPIADRPGYSYTYDLDGKMTVMNNRGQSASKQLPKFHWNLGPEAGQLADLLEATSPKNVDEQQKDPSALPKFFTRDIREASKELLN